MNSNVIFATEKKTDQEDVYCEVSSVADNSSQ